MKRFFCIMAVSFGWLMALPVFAYSGKTGLEETNKGSGAEGLLFDPNLTLPQMVGNVINGFLVMIGLILMIIIIIGGIKYMMAGGEQKDVQTGKDYIKNGIVGLIIISLAYAFSSYVVKNIGGATTGTPTPTPTQTTAPAANGTP